MSSLLDLLRKRRARFVSRCSSGADDEGNASKNRRVVQAFNQEVPEAPWPLKYFIPSQKPKATPPSQSKPPRHEDAVDLTPSFMRSDDSEPARNDPTPRTRAPPGKSSAADANGQKDPQFPWERSEADLDKWRDTMQSPWASRLRRLIQGDVPRTPTPRVTEAPTNTLEPVELRDLTPTQRYFYELGGSRETSLSRVAFFIRPALAAGLLGLGVGSLQAWRHRRPAHKIVPFTGLKFFLHALMVITAEAQMRFLTGLPAPITYTTTGAFYGATCGQFSGGALLAGSWALRGAAICGGGYALAQAGHAWSWNGMQRWYNDTLMRVPLIQQSTLYLRRAVRVERISEAELAERDANTQLHTAETMRDGRDLFALDTNPNTNMAAFTGSPRENTIGSGEMSMREVKKVTDEGLAKATADRAPEIRAKLRKSTQLKQERLDVRTDARKSQNTRKLYEMALQSGEEEQT